VADVGLLGMAESPQPRNRHMAKADEMSRDRVMITLFSTLSSLQPVRVTKRSPVSATPPSGRLGGRVLGGRGYRQRERAGYGARSEGVVAESLEGSYSWAVGFFFGNVKLSMELWTVIAGISGFDD
jgi:hypothetical protein